jgi:hypothetical protein
MNKLFNAAETAALDLATAAPASTITFTAEAKKPLLQRWFSYLRLRKAARLRTDPMVNVESQLANERGFESVKHHSPLCDLAANNSHVILASLFSRKFR